MKIPARLYISESGKPESEYLRIMEEELQRYSHKLSEVLNSGLTFADNVKCEIKPVSDTGEADTEFTVAHTLKTTPSGFIVIKNNKAGYCYTGSTTWTSTNLYLKCSADNCAVTIIVLG